MTDKERLYISSIAQHGSITKAAEALFIAQPSLTQALHRIEAEYQVSFFHRGRKGLQLTEAGQEYLAAAETITRIYKNMEYEIGTVSGNQRGRISLGINSFQGGILLPELLVRYQQQFPLMDLKLLEASSSQLESLVSKSRLDLAILHQPFQEHVLNHISLHREPFYLAVSPKNPDYLAAVSKSGPFPHVTADIIGRQPLIMMSSAQRIRQVAESVCAAAGVTPRERFSTTSFATAMALAEKGLGAAFAPVSYINYYARGKHLAYFQFPHEWNAQWELVAAYNKQLPLSKSCLELVRVIQSCISSMPEIFQ